MKTRVTNNVSISVSYQYQNRYSDDEKRDHVFFYKISIENCGLQKIKLINQYRELIDSGRFSVSKKQHDPEWGQPDILPGQKVTYDCACSLKSPIGKLLGHIEVALLGIGEVFEARIPETELYATSILN